MKRETMPTSSMLKGQDILIALLLASEPHKRWTQPEIAQALSLRLGEVNNALNRGHASGILHRLSKSQPIDLISAVPRGGVSGFTPVTSAMHELLTHAVKCFLPPIWGNITRGIPTAYAAPIMSEALVVSEVLPVWEYPKGTVRARSLQPIHPNAPLAAVGYRQLYHLLAPTDVMHIGQSREVSIARDLLRQHLRSKA